MASYGHTFTSGDTVTPTKLNAARTVSDIVNADIKSDAAIALSKLATGALPAAITVASANIVDGTIVNADINASAAIAGTKITPDFGSQNVTTTGAGAFGFVNVSSVYPALQLAETDASSNNQRWDIVADAEGMFVRAVNDAYTAASNAIEIQRTGTAIDSVSMPNGNVGVGTSNPQRKLHCAVSAAPAASLASKTGLLIENSNATGNAGSPNTASIQFAYDPASPRAYIEAGTFGNDLLAFGFAGTERMRIDATGNVGIGTTTPSAKLDVNGNIKVLGQLNVDPASHPTTKPSSWGGGVTTFDVYASGSVGVGSADGSTVRSLMGNDGNAWFTGNVTASIFTGNLTGNVTGNVTGNLTGTASAIANDSVTDAKVAAGANIADTKLATIATAGKVANSATTATNANTANAIVARDASGNFSAGTITASLSGNVTGNVTGNLTGTASAIADGSVSTAKIVNGAVTDDKIASGVDASKLTVGTLPIARIADAAVTPAKLSQPYTLATAKNSTSGTSIDFTGIPSWAKRITVMFNGVSTNGTSVVIVQIGSGSFTTSGYSATGWGSAGTNVGNSGHSTGFPTTDGGELAADARSGIATLVTLGSNIWAFNSSVRRDSGRIGCGAGSLTLSGTLDRIRITTVNGTDNFDAGTINIAYEG